MEETDDGGSGSDSEASGAAGAAGDGYDCEDDFIDDAELDDPQEVVGEAKHDGFFINKVRQQQAGYCSTHFSVFA